MPSEPNAEPHGLLVIKLLYFLRVLFAGFKLGGDAKVKEFVKVAIKMKSAIRQSPCSSWP